MNSQIENFPDCVKCEVTEIISRLDAMRLMALREFLQTWVGILPTPSAPTRHIEPIIHVQPKPVETVVPVEPEPEAEPRKRGRKSRVSDDELRRLVERGLSDTEIARRFGMTKAGIRNHRARLGLAANFKRGQKATKPKPITYSNRLVVVEAVPVKLKMPEPDANGVRHCPPGPEDDELHFDNHQFE